MTDRTTRLLDAARAAASVLERLNDHYRNSEGDNPEYLALAAAVAAFDAPPDDLAPIQYPILVGPFGRNEGVTISFDREQDGRWIAKIEALPGCLAYGDTKDMALVAVVERYAAARGFPITITVVKSDAT